MTKINNYKQRASVKAPSSPAGAAEPALPGRRRSGPSGGSALREAKSVGAPSSQAGAAEPALPGRRRSGPLGGQGATRSERPWGPNV